ncbi:MAG: hypothetical protein K6F72_02280 [Bacteroidales bacterium]|nr:hypothetical protein [Bacteroidales bacterium]
MHDIFFPLSQHQFSDRGAALHPDIIDAPREGAHVEGGRLADGLSEDGADVAECQPDGLPGEGVCVSHPSFNS